MHIISCNFSLYWLWLRIQLSFLSFICSYPFSLFSSLLWVYFFFILSAIVFELIGSHYCSYIRLQNIYIDKELHLVHKTHQIISLNYREVFLSFLFVHGSYVSDVGKASFSHSFRTCESLWINGFRGSLGDSNNTHAEIVAILHGLKLDIWDKILGMLFATLIPCTLLTLLLILIFISTIIRLKSNLSMIYWSLVRMCN